MRSTALILLRKDRSSHVGWNFSITRLLARENQKHGASSTRKKKVINIPSSMPSLMGFTVSMHLLLLFVISKACILKNKIKLRRSFRIWSCRWLLVSLLVFQAWMNTNLKIFKSFKRHVITYPWGKSPDLKPPSTFCWMTS